MILNWLEGSASTPKEGCGPNLAQAVAVLPLGSVEAHGPHLPIGTDTILAERLLDRAEPALHRDTITVLRLPALWLGASVEHVGQRGTASVDAEIVVANVSAVAAAMSRLGVCRLILWNAHGGNVAALAIAALAARRSHGLLVANAHWLDFGVPPSLALPTPVREDVHGGWMETSLMLELAPDLVVPGAIEANPPRQLASCLYPYGPIDWAWLSEDLASGGWAGRPDLATADLGRALSEHITLGVIQLVQDLAGTLWPQATGGD